MNETTPTVVDEVSESGVESQGDGPHGVVGERCSALPRHNDIVVLGPDDCNSRGHCYNGKYDDGGGCGAYGGSGGGDDDDDDDDDDGDDDDDNDDDSNAL